MKRITAVFKDGEFNMLLIDGFKCLETRKTTEEEKQTEKKNERLLHRKLIKAKDGEIISMNCVFIRENHETEGLLLQRTP